MAPGEIQLLLPECFLLAGALLLLVVDPFLGKRSLAPWGALLTFAASAAAAVAVGGPGTSLFVGMFRCDSFLLLARLAGAGLGLLLTALSWKFTRQENIPRCEYFSLLLLASIGVNTMAGATDLVLLFLGLEILSLASYVLAAIRRNQAESCEAGVKYFFTGSITAAVMLYGIAWVYGTVQGTSYSRLHDVLFTGAGLRDVPFGLVLGLLMVCVGLFFKLAVTPFHAWAPDVYQGAPTPVSAFFASLPKVAGFLALVRFAASTAGAADGFLGPWFTACCVVTMLVGNLAALRQDNIKRMLAYSSIGHAGYIMLGVLTGTLNAVSAVVFYVVVYGIMTVGAFAAVCAISGRGDRRTAIDDFRGVGFERPFLGLALAVCILSLAGIPSTAGFIGKFQLFAAALEQGRILPVLAALLASLIGIGYYLRVLVALYAQPRTEGPSTAPLPAGTGVVLALCALASLGFGVFPSPLLEGSAWVGAGLLVAP